MLYEVWPVMSERIGGQKMAKVGSFSTTRPRGLGSDNVCAKGRALRQNQVNTSQREKGEADRV